MPEAGRWGAKHNRLCVLNIRPPRRFGVSHKRARSLRLYVLKTRPPRQVDTEAR